MEEVAEALKVGMLGAYWARVQPAVEAAAAAPRATVKLAIGGEIPGFESYDEAINAEDDSDIDNPVLGRSMLYTSGTTGRPKGVHRPPVATPANTVVGGVSGYKP